MGCQTPLCNASVNCVCGQHFKRDYRSNALSVPCLADPKLLLPLLTIKSTFWATVLEKAIQTPGQIENTKNDPWKTTDNRLQRLAIKKLLQPENEHIFRWEFYQNVGEWSLLGGTVITYLGGGSGHFWVFITGRVFDCNFVCIRNSKFCHRFPEKIEKRGGIILIWKISLQI